MRIVQSSRRAVSGFVGLVVILLVSACSTAAQREADFGPNYLTRAADAGQMEDRARESCLIQTVGLDLVAALDSSSASLRELDEQWNLNDGFDRELPADSNEFVAVCVYSTASNSTLGDDFRWLAMWTDELATKTDILVGWN